MGDSVLSIRHIPLQISGIGDHKDSISCLTVVKDGKIVFGTQHGRLVVCSDTGKTILELKKVTDKLAMTAVSCDMAGEFICASSKDKSLKVFALTDSSEVYAYTHKAPIVMSALDMMCNPREKPFIAFADDQGAVFRVSKTFLGTRRVEQIAANQGIVQKIYIRNGIVAWATNSLIAVWSEKERKLMYEIVPKFPETFPSERRVSFLNLSDKILGVSIGCFYYELHLDKVRRVAVNMRKNVMAMLNEQTNKITMQLLCEKSKMKFFIDQSSNIVMVKPREFDRNPDEFIDLVKRDHLSQILVLRTHVYHIRFIGWEKHIRSLLNGEERNEVVAIEKFKKISDSISDEERMELIEQIVGHLIDKGRVKTAAELCGSFLKPLVNEWNWAIEVFEKKQILIALTPFIPVDVLKQSDRNVDVLIALLKAESQRFFEIFAELPADSFDPDCLIREIVSGHNEAAFQIPLMFLYQRKNRWNDAFDAGLSANYLKLFDDIEKAGYYRYPLIKFRELCETYGSIFTRFLYSHVQDIDPASVLDRFDHYPEMDRYMCEYLHQLYSNRTAFPEKYHTKLALLYVKFHDPNTMSFIKQPDTKFDYQMVLGAAMNEGLYQEAAFLCYKMGRSVDGMKIHLNYIKNPKEAVEYAINAGNEQSVVDELVRKAYEDVNLLACVIENMPSLELDHLRFMKNIPKKLFDENPLLLNAVARAIEEFRKHLKTVELIHYNVGNTVFNMYKQQMTRHSRAVLKTCPSYC